MALSRAFEYCWVCSPRHSSVILSCWVGQLSWKEAY